MAKRWPRLPALAVTKLLWPKHDHASKPQMRSQLGVWRPAGRVLGGVADFLALGPSGKAAIGSRTPFERRDCGVSGDGGSSRKSGSGSETHATAAIAKLDGNRSAV